MWELPEKPDRVWASNVVSAALEQGADTGCPSAASSAAGPAVTTTVPGVDEPHFRQWIGTRIVYWPDGVCLLRRVALLSSRVGQRHDLIPWWYDLLRTAAMRLQAGECLCLSRGTAAFEPAQRAAELFGLPTLRLEVSDRDCTSDELVDWLLHAVADHDSLKTDIPAWRALVSPRVVSESSSVQRPDITKRTDDGPVRDRALVLASQKTFVLVCRTGGHIERQVRCKLADDCDAACATFVALSPDLPASGAETLVDSGAVPWIVSGLTVNTRNTVLRVKKPAERRGLRDETVSPLRGGPLEEPEDWLAHWTRPQFGPWPEQDQHEFLDELILGCPSSNRSALATLLRICATGRLIGSDTSARGDQPVVSFTAVPLAEFRQRRVFRRHRHRFDFEPWGIAARREALLGLGARPVIYGDESGRQKLPETDRLYFQPAKNCSGSINWKAEREWRLAGALELTSLRDEDVVVFVDSEREAAMFDDLPWRSVVCPG